MLLPLMSSDCRLGSPGSADATCRTNRGFRVWGPHQTNIAATNWWQCSDCRLVSPCNVAATTSAEEVGLMDTLRVSHVLPQLQQLVLSRSANTICAI